MLHVCLKQYEKCLWVLFLSIMARPSVSADRAIDPFVYLKEQYNSNLRLDAGPHKDVWNTTGGAGVRLRAVEEAWGVLGDIRLESRRFHGQDELNTDNQYFKASSFYKTERMRWDLGASYFRDSSVVTQDLEEVDITGDANRRSRIRVTPAWTYRLTETTDLGFLYSYRDVFHDNAEEVGRIDYKTHEAKSFLTHNISETTGYTPALSYLSYQEADSPFSADLYGATVNFFTAFTETLTGSLALGARYASASGQPANADDSDAGLLVNAFLTKRFEDTRLTASYIRDVYVTGASGLTERDKVALGVRTAFSEMLDGSLQLIFLDQETLLTSRGRRESQNYRANANVRLHLTDHFNLALAYQYTLKDRALGARDADSHAAFLTLEYNFGDIRF